MNKGLEANKGLEVNNGFWLHDAPGGHLSRPVGLDLPGNGPRFPAPGNSSSASSGPSATPPACSVPSIV